MKKRNFWPILFIGPFMIIFILFVLIPAIFGVVVAFTDWDLYNSPIFVGLENFKTILFDTESIYHEQFFNGAKNTLLFVLFSVPLCIVIPLTLAVLLSMKPKGHKLFQSMLYIPTLFAISAVMIIWSFQLSLSYGPLKEWFGLDFNITATQPWAWIAVIGVTLWWCAGNNMIIYVAALNAIPKDQIEAAQIDGAGGIIRFFKIILPNIKSQLLFTTVTTTIAQFNVYGQPLMLTDGGPNNSTRVLMMYIQENAFGTGVSTAGMSAAMAVLLGLIIMIFSSIQFVMNRKTDA